MTYMPVRLCAWVGGAALVVGAAVALPMAAGGSPGQSVTSLASGGVTADQLAQSLVGSGITISNITYTGDAHAAGSFSGMSALGINSGIALSSGAVATEDGYESSVVGPNDNDQVSGEFGTAGDPSLDALIAPDTTQDAAVLEFDFVPTTDQVSFNYVFGSDEYNEFIGSFNDVFGFFVNGTNCATVGKPPQPVSVNDINGTTNSSLFRDNDPSDEGQPSIDAQMDGLTTVLTCSAPAHKNQTNHLKLAIADAVDTQLDSDVFIGAGSIQANTPPSANPDSYTATSGSTLTVPAPGVLGNDTDAEHDPLTVDPSSVTSPTHGSVTVNADGGFAYVPNSGYTGPDSFTYKASDGAADSDPATVSIDVQSSGGDTTPPVVDAGPDVSGLVNQAVQLTGTATDANLQSTTWTGQDGAPCTFADPHAQSTTITCTAAGDYTVTLSATDGTNTSSDTAVVHVHNPSSTRKCDGVPATIIGTSGGSVIHGTAGRDVIVGSSGDDVIYGGGGDDLICGGDGNDVIRGQTGNDTVYGQAGNDKIYGGTGDDYLLGGGGADLIKGQQGNDKLVGNSGDDHARGGPDDDSLYGDDGNDKLFGNGGTNNLHGGRGTDVCGSPTDGTDTKTTCEQTGP